MKNPAFAARGFEVDRQRASVIAAHSPKWSLRSSLSTAAHLGDTGTGAVLVHIVLERRHMTMDADARTSHRTGQPPPQIIPHQDILRIEK